MMWTPPDGQKEVMLDDWCEYFEMVIPPEVADIASGVKQLREWRVRWRAEITVEHRPITGVGYAIRNTYNLQLYDHRTPPPLPSEPPLEMTLRSNFTDALVRVKAPHRAYGPEEHVKIVACIMPQDPYVIVRKVQLVLERRMELLDHKSAVAALRERDSQSPVPGAPGSSVGVGAATATAAAADMKQPSRMSTLFNRGSSPRRAPTTSDANNSRVITTRILDTVCDVTDPDADNTTWSTGVLKLPVRGCRWDMAHTEQTMFVDISFNIRVKITLKPGKGRGGSQVLETDPIPITILACSKLERKMASRALRDMSGSSTDAEDADSSALSRYEDDIRQAKRRNLHTSSSSSSAGREKMDIAAITNNYEPPPPRYSPPKTEPSSSNSSMITLDSRPRTAESSRTVESESRNSPNPTPSPAATPLLRQVLSPPPQSPPPRYRMSPTPAPSLGASSVASSAIVSPDPMPVDADYEHNLRRERILAGRRISATASEDEEGQPLRARQKLYPIQEPAMLSLGAGVTPRRCSATSSMAIRHQLPSLDALGFGLPEVHTLPEHRPRTAPTYGGRQAVPLSSSSSGRPQSSGGTFAFTTPFARRNT